jgi:hypothetical protein
MIGSVAERAHERRVVRRASHQLGHRIQSHEIDPFPVLDVPLWRAVAEPEAQIAAASRPASSS